MDFEHFRQHNLKRGDSCNRAGGLRQYFSLIWWHEKSLHPRPPCGRHRGGRRSALPLPDGEPVPAGRRAGPAL